MSANHYPRCKTLFFAGTDTDVGKTYVASLVTRQILQAGFRVGVYKPVASGCRRSAGTLIADDAQQLWNAAGKPRDLDQVCPQRFEAALAPPEAAKLESKEVDPHLLTDGAAVWREESDWLIVEGAGGLMSPLAIGVLNADLAHALNPLRLIIVCANRLGAVHQCLSTVEAARHRNLNPFGIVLNTTSRQSDPSTATNRRQIADYSDVPVLGEVGYDAARVDDAIIQPILS